MAIKFSRRNINRRRAKKLSFMSTAAIESLEYRIVLSSTSARPVVHGVTDTAVEKVIQADTHESAAPSLGDTILRDEVIQSLGLANVSSVETVAIVDDSIRVARIAADESEASGTPVEETESENNPPTILSLEVEFNDVAGLWIIHGEILDESPETAVLVIEGITGDVEVEVGADGEFHFSVAIFEGLTEGLISAVAIDEYGLESARVFRFV